MFKTARNYQLPSVPLGRGREDFENRRTVCIDEKIQGGQSGEKVVPAICHNEHTSPHGSGCIVFLGVHRFRREDVRAGVRARVRRR